MNQLLAHPPLREVACEIRFKAGAPWDWLVPAQLFERFRERFPRREGVRANQIMLAIQAGHVQQVDNQLRLERVAMLSENRAARIQIGHDRVIVNHVQPYPGWDIFSTLIMDLFNAYVELTGYEEIERIGLRYINGINLSEGGPDESGLLDIGTVITLDPPIPEPIKAPVYQFYQEYVLVHDDVESLLKHRTAFQPPRGDADALDITLDLDFYTLGIADYTDNAVRQWLRVAHERITDAFVASVHPDVLNRMREGGQQ